MFEGPVAQEPSPLLPTPHCARPCLPPRAAQDRHRGRAARSRLRLPLYPPRDCDTSGIAIAAARVGATTSRLSGARGPSVFPDALVYVMFLMSSRCIARHVMHSCHASAGDFFACSRLTKRCVGSEAGKEYSWPFRTSRSPLKAAHCRGRHGLKWCEGQRLKRLGPDPYYLLLFLDANMGGCGEFHFSFRSISGAKPPTIADLQPPPPHPRASDLATM